MPPSCPYCMILLFLVSSLLFSSVITYKHKITCHRARNIEYLVIQHAKHSTMTRLLDTHGDTTQLRDVLLQPEALFLWSLSPHSNMVLERTACGCRAEFPLRPKPTTGNCRCAPNDVLPDLHTLVELNLVAERIVYIVPVYFCSLSLACLRGDSLHPNGQKR